MNKLKTQTGKLFKSHKQLCFALIYQPKKTGVCRTWKIAQNIPNNKWSALAVENINHLLQLLTDYVVLMVKMTKCNCTVSLLLTFTRKLFTCTYVQLLDHGWWLQLQRYWKKKSPLTHFLQIWRLLSLQWNAICFCSTSLISRLQALLLSEYVLFQNDLSLMASRNCLSTYSIYFEQQFGLPSWVTGPVWAAAFCPWCTGGGFFLSAPPCGWKAWDRWLRHGCPRIPCRCKGSVEGDSADSLSEALTQLSLET